MARTVRIARLVSWRSSSVEMTPGAFRLAAAATLLSSHADGRNCAKRALAQDLADTYTPRVIAGVIISHG